MEECEASVTTITGLNRLQREILFNLAEVIGDSTVTLSLVDYISDGSNCVYASIQWRARDGLKKSSIVFDERFILQSETKIQLISSKIFAEPTWDNFIKIIVTVNRIDDSELLRIEDEYINIPNDDLLDVTELVGSQFSGNIGPILSFHRFWIFANYKNPISYKGKNILLSGSGSSAEALICMLSGAKKCVGMDVDERSISFAKKRFSNVEGVSFTSTLPQEYLFDLIISRHVMEHVAIDRWNSYLSDLSYILSPDGCILIDFPNQKNPIEPHTEILFFHLLNKAERSRIYNYCEQVQPSWYLPIRDRLRALVNHQNVCIDTFLASIPNDLRPASIQYIDSTSHDYSGDDADTIRVVLKKKI